MKPMVPAEARELFRSTFGRDPQVLASAPGRVNLIGEHLDYNGGQVLPIAIERRTAVAIGRRKSSDSSVAVSSSEPTRGIFDVRDPARSGKWWDYLAGVALNLGLKLPQMEIAVASDVPSGAGLSSSAALEVASGLAMMALIEQEIAPIDLARTGWRAENGFVGVASGIMDQFASALGRDGEAVHVWCDSERTEYVPFRGVVLVFDTGITRSLRGSEFNTRREECQHAFELLKRDFPALSNLAAATPEQVIFTKLPEPLASRALHVATENLRVERAVSHLKRDGSFPGSLLYESHVSLRDLYECSTPQLNWFVERAASEPGIDGARLTGAGWGGCAIAMGEAEALRRAADAIASEYERTFDLKPRTWITRAAQGAEIVALSF